MRLLFLGLVLPMVFARFAAAESLRVMSFNIRYGTANDGEDSWPNRRELVVRTIRQFDPDLLGLQEALHSQLEQLDEALPEHERIGVGRDDGQQAGEYAAIYYRTGRLRLVDSGTFWLSDTPEVAGSKSWGNNVVRCCTWGRFVDQTLAVGDPAGEDGPRGGNFLMFNTHWDHESQPSRLRSAALVVERISTTARESEPVLLTGDFNAGETNPAFVRLLGGDLGFRDTFRQLHQTATEVGTSNRFRGNRDGEKIDAVLATPQWQVESAAIDRTSEGDRYPSDHFPVTAVVRRID